MSNVLRGAAFGAFVVAIYIGLVPDEPDVVSIVTAIAIGLALWVGSTLTP